MTMPHLMNCPHQGEGWCLGCVAALYGEVERLRRGDFTPEEFQNLCHNLGEDDYKHFCDGCDAYQKKLFGKCRTDDTVDSMYSGQ